MIAIRHTALSLCLLLIPLPALSARALPTEVILGTWGVHMRGHFTVADFGTETFKGDGNCAITARDKVSDGLDCQGFDSEHSFSGSLYLGRKRHTLRWALDNHGEQQIKNQITRWLIAKRQARGQVLTAEQVDYEIHRVAYPKVKVAQRDSRPVQLRVKLRGRVIQLVNNRYVIKPYRYALRVKFLAKAL